MKILFLPNWKVEKCRVAPSDKQPPDYNADNEVYWFFKHFKQRPDIDIIDTRSFSAIEKFEQNKIRFYVIQAIKAIPKLNKYDYIISHGMQSGVVVSLWRRFFKGKAKHIVFDIGSFNSAAESGFALKLMQYASRSIDGIIYHTSSQKEYYRNFYPWILNKCKFIRFGTDLDFFVADESTESNENLQNDYMICVGYAKRDWNTLIEAYKRANTSVHLKLVGHVDSRFEDVNGIEQIPRLPIKDLLKHIKASRFCILPLESFNYSFGQMTLMQQMALEKCVLAANVPSLVDYIIDDETAVLYHSGNSAELAQKMEVLLKNTALCEKIGKNARAWLKDNCNEKKMADEIEDFISTL